MIGGVVGYLPPRDEAIVRRDLIAAYLPWYWRRRKRAAFWLEVDGYATARAQMAISANHPQVSGDVHLVADRILERLEGREGQGRRSVWASSS